MKRSWFTEERIIAILRGRSLPRLARLTEELKRQFRAQRK